jgi:CRISPR-associated protein Csm3
MSMKLDGKLFISGKVRTITGLLIGGADVGLEIGGLDRIVVRNPVDDRPYIPGSSLKGKMRSLVERRLGLEPNKEIRAQEPKVRIHECGAERKDGEDWTKYAEEYEECDVCKVFGVAGEIPFATPTRLQVRDVALSTESAKAWDEGKVETDLPYTEVKWEAAIDRITAAAVPRQFERVPSSVVFEPMQLVFNFYEGDDLRLLRRVFEAMELVQDDYLGGMGSRGYGEIAFEELTLTLKTGDYYEDPQTSPAQTIREGISLKELREEERAIVSEIEEVLGGD